MNVTNVKLSQKLVFEAYRVVHVARWEKGNLFVLTNWKERLSYLQEMKNMLLVEAELIGRKGMYNIMSEKVVDLYNPLEVGTFYRPDWRQPIVSNY